MAEFRIHHHISELLDFLGIESSYAESSMEEISRSMISNAGVQNLSSLDIEHLARGAPNPPVFVKKYDDFKERNVAELTSMVSFLRELKEDTETLENLQSRPRLLESYLNFRTPTRSTLNMLSEFDEPSSVKLTSSDINRLKERLLEGSLRPVENSTDTIDKIVKKESQKSVGLPVVPSWIYSRPHMSLNFVIPDSDYYDENLGALGEVGVNTQENQLIQDLLHLMVGCRGTYVTTTMASTLSGPPIFNIDSSVETSLRSLVKRILPLAQYYSQVIAFVEEYSKYKYGLVNHALVAAIRNLLKDYLLLVTQLETQQRRGALTLRRLWFYVEKTLTMMEMLSCLTTSIAKSYCHGGGVLSLLHERTLSLTGCGQLQEVMTFLTQAASVPYMKILKFWIHRGVINDPYLEFMVVDNEDIDSIKESFISHNEIMDDYWKKRYSLQDSNVPTFLQSHSDMILRTGKYLNVIRDSGVSVAYPEQEDVSYSVRSQSYSETIEKTYNFASKRLLELMMKEKDLMGRLKSIKHFFLLDQGDFVAQLLTLCGSELAKNIDDVVPTRLVSLLELALRMSAANCHVYKDDVACTLMPYSLMNQMMKILSIETDDEREFRAPPERIHMNGLQGFSLTYEIEWPLSLVIDKKSLFCYQMIFRHLFYCKHVERLLCRVWLTSKGMKSRRHGCMSSYNGAFSLRHRMLLFIENLEYYMNFEVIERNWQNFNAQMHKVENIDEVLACHLEFLNGCLTDCMLTTPELLRIVTKLTAICVNFSNFILHHDPEFIADDTSENFQQAVARFDLEFTAMLVTLIEKITDMGRENYNDALNHLLYRLDFNRYYAEKSKDLQIASAPDNSLELI